MLAIMAILLLHLDALLIARAQAKKNPAAAGFPFLT
jgi:hypothetical protein